MLRIALLFICTVLFPAMTAIAAFAAIPRIGATAPGFALTSQEGTNVRLSDFKGKWIVLYFYPKDFTSGCTLQARNSG